MSPFQEIQNVFFEIRANIDVGLIQERRRAARFYFACNLLCHPGVCVAMADEDQTPFWFRALIH